MPQVWQKKYCQTFKANVYNLSLSLYKLCSALLKYKKKSDKNLLHLGIKHCSD